MNLKLTIILCCKKRQDVPFPFLIWPRRNTTDLNKFNQKYNTSVSLFINTIEAGKTQWSISWICSCTSNTPSVSNCRRFQGPRRLRRGSAAAHLLGLRVRIPPVLWMSVSCKCCLLSGRDLCFGLITLPEESYRVWSVWVLSWSLDNEEALAKQGMLRRR